jgi:hypothetical protein
MLHFEECARVVWQADIATENDVALVELASGSTRRQHDNTH